MEHLKIKVIGVLREREEAVNDAVRQLPKMSALDLAGILNCRRRLEWTKEWLKKNRSEFLSKENLLKDIQFRNNETYHLNCFFDITERQFRFLVSKLSPVISSYEPQRKKKPFSAEERIAITLKYLATGEVHSCRHYCFRASKPVILQMIANICLSIYELLKDQFFALPKTDAQWQNISDEVQRKHRLPNCLGTLSLLQMQFYNSSRTEEEPNYATKAPLILTAMVDSSNNFLYADIEKTRATAPSDVFEQSTLKQSIENKTFQLPAHEPEGAPYFVGSYNLPCKSYLQSTPYYNDRINGDFELSNEFLYTFYTMHTVNMHMEQTLRMLSNIFPILAQPLRIDEENGRKIALGCIALYNFLRKTDRSFLKRTEKIHCNADEDDDCILVANEEELHEREEFQPHATVTTCFKHVQKQLGDTTAGLSKREHILSYVAENNLLD